MAKNFPPEFEQELLPANVAPQDLGPPLTGTEVGPVLHHLRTLRKEPEGVKWYDVGDIPLCDVESFAYAMYEMLPNTMDWLAFRRMDVESLYEEFLSLREAVPPAIPGTPVGFVLDLTQRREHLAFLFATNAEPDESTKNRTIDLTGDEYRCIAWSHLTIEIVWRGDGKVTRTTKQCIVPAEHLGSPNFIAAFPPKMQEKALSVVSAEAFNRFVLNQANDENDWTVRFDSMEFVDDHRLAWCKPGGLYEPIVPLDEGVEEPTQNVVLELTWEGEQIERQIVATEDGRFRSMDGEDVFPVIARFAVGAMGYYDDLLHMFLRQQIWTGLAKRPFKEQSDPLQLNWDLDDIIKTLGRERVPQRPWTRAAVWKLSLATYWVQWVCTEYLPGTVLDFAERVGLRSRKAVSHV